MEENTAVLNTIQLMTNKVFSSIDDSLITVVDKLLYVDESLLNENTFSLYTNKLEMTMEVIAESILFGYILYYLIRYLISRITLVNKDEIENPAIFFIKIIITSIAIIYARDLCKILIQLNSSISKDFANNYVSGGLLPNLKRFLHTVNYVLLGGETEINIFSLDGIFKGFVSFGTLNIAVSLALRYILIQILILISPIIFIFKSFSKTEKLFNMWIKTFISLLLIQHFFTILLVLASSLQIQQLSVFNKIAYIGIIYAMSKSFNLFEKIFGAIAPNVQVSFPFK